MEYNLGFLAFSSAIILFVGYQQWKTTKKKFILACYDRRFKVYEEVRGFIELVNQKGSPTNDDVINFKSATHEAEFLFGSKISQYINVIIVRGEMLKIMRHNEKTDETLKDDKGTRAIKAESDWFVEQAKEVKMEFKKYLDVSD